MKRGSEHGIEVSSKHLSSSIELREDDIRGAERPVDVLVRRPDGVRPHLRPKSDSISAWLQQAGASPNTNNRLR